MTQPETPSAIQADRAFARLTRTLARTAPRHLHNAQQSWRMMRRLRKGF